MVYISVLSVDLIMSFMAFFFHPMQDHTLHLVVQYPLCPLNWKSSSGSVFITLTFWTQSWLIDFISVALILDSPDVSSWLGSGCVFTDRILHECMSSPDTLLLIEPEELRAQELSPRGAQRGRGCQGQQLILIQFKGLTWKLAGNQKQEMRFGIEEKRKGTRGSYKR